MKNAISIAVVILVVFFVIALAPVQRSQENSIEVSGIVKSVKEGGAKDLVFELEHDQTTYYINRGFENRFEITEAKRDFEGQKITLYYVDCWTILAPFGTNSKHITRASINKSVIFSEW